MSDEITKEDVWGKWDENHNKVSDGMVVANHNYGGFDEAKCRSVKRCPVFKSFIGYKEVTVVCDKDQIEEVLFWLDYVQGAGSFLRAKPLKNGKAAIRSQYTAW